MYHDYSDITDRIAEPPKWWDEHGVSRYGQFSPYGVANIYAQEVALVEIACQWCGQLFEVAFSFPPEIEDTLGKSATLAEAIRSGKINYGDPPDYGNCQSGPSMSCYDLRVLQYWSRWHNKGVWVRDSQQEMDLPDRKEHGKR